MSAVTAISRAQPSGGHTKLENSRWSQVLAHTPSSDFVYAVISTHIYCRATCPSRRPRRANVTFFDNPAAAEKAGFRACKRCKPGSLGKTRADGTVGNSGEGGDEDLDSEAAAKSKVRAACKYIDDLKGETKLVDVAKHVGLSPRYFHGVFKNVTGQTPGLYAERIRRGIKEETQIQQAQVDNVLSTLSTDQELSTFSPPFPGYMTPMTEISMGTGTSTGTELGPTTPNEQQYSQPSVDEILYGSHSGALDSSTMNSFNYDFMLDFYGDANTYAELNGMGLGLSQDGIPDLEQPFDFNQPMQVGNLSVFPPITGAKEMESDMGLQQHLNHLPGELAINETLLSDHAMQSVLNEPSPTEDPCLWDV